MQDHELGLACLRTYNDFLLDEWCATDRARLFGAVILATAYAGIVKWD